MAKVYGGQIIAKVLKQNKVEHCFALVSGHLDAVYLACEEAGIKFMDNRSEYAVGFAALGYAKTSGKPGVLMVAPGGGVTNITNAVGSAYTDCIPMVIIGGQNPLMDYEGLTVNCVGNGLDTQADIMKPITKWSVQVPDITRLADMLGIAFRRATSGRPGPVYVEICNPITWQEIEESEIRYLKDVEAVKPAPPQEAVNFILEKIKSAKRPVICAGTGAVFSGCAPLLTEFIERMNLPLLTNHKSRGIIPTKHHLWGKSFATIAACANQGTSPDLIIMLGARFGLFAGGFRGCFFPKESFVIQVDVEGGEFGRIHDPDYPVIADCKETLKALLAATENQPNPDFGEWAKTVNGIAMATKKKSLELLGSDEGAVNSGDLAAIVSQNVPEDIVLAFGGGEATTWADAVMNTSGPGKTVHHGYLGNIGEGTPQAIGAAVANPDLPVILMTSDGDVGYTFAEFETMVRHNLRIIAVVNNNSTWGMCSHSQDLLYDGKKRIISDFGKDVRYDLAAAGFGAHGEFVTKRSEIIPALERALASGKPALINVLTDDHAFHPMVRRNVSNAAFTKDEQGRNFVPWSENYFA